MSTLVVTCTYGISVNAVDKDILVDPMILASQKPPSLPIKDAGYILEQHVVETIFPFPKTNGRSKMVSQIDASRIVFKRFVLASSIVFKDLCWPFFD